MMNYRKMRIAVVLLLICTVLLVSASYAWLSIARMPEISGIETHIGANGSLEIALLSESTYLDPTLIPTKIGSSAVSQQITVSNLSWGNLVDLTDESYGLGEISLLPARLNIHAGGDDRNTVGGNILVMPTFGADGRFQTMQTDAVSAVYGQEGFVYSTENQNYGVRGIGTISDLSVQQAALTGARSAIRAYTSASVSAAQSTWKANGGALLRICCDHYIRGQQEYTDADVAVLRDTAARMLGALSYVDLALRQGIVGYGAAMIDDEDLFRELRDNAENTLIPLSVIVSQVAGNLPNGLENRIRVVEQDKLTMQQLIAACDALRGGSYSWTQIEYITNQLLKLDKVYLGEVKLSQMSSSTQVATGDVLTIIPGAGVMADLADYSGNYSAYFQYADGIDVETVTVSTVEPSYLVEIADTLDQQEAAGSAGATEAKLQEIYGFAVDMAFRCNTQSQLLLQTQAALRVDADQENASGQGEGSFVGFESDQLTTEQIVMLIDALRIGFLDNQNNLLAVAKPNTSNYSVDSGSVFAALYLYDFTVCADGSISMGERRTEDGVITELPESTPVVITVVVWLDGDHVDNSLVANTAKAMEGKLNLQFSSSAELNGADIPVQAED